MNCDCGHEVIPGSFSPVRVPLTDDEGFPIVDLETGEVLYQTFRLPDHRFRLPGNERDPEVTMPDGFVRGSRWDADPRGVVHSELDPFGLCTVMCEHGLKRHPDGRDFYPRSGQSWVRARYATTDMQCVVDRGDPVPDDLTTPRS